MHPKTLSINTRRLVLMANVKDAPFKCSSCKKVFISENHLRRHEDRRHNTRSLSISSPEVKEGTIQESANESTIKAVLNATERIEDLLVKLSIRDSEKNKTIPLALSSPRSSFDYSLVTSSSFTCDRHDPNFQNDCISNEKPKEKVELEYYERENFQDLVVSNSIKSEPNVENCEHFSNKNKVFKSNNLPMMYSSPTSNFDYSPVASCSFSAEKNEQRFFENFKHVWSESISNQKLYGIKRLKLKDKSIMTDDSLISNSIATSKNEENVENYDYNSKQIISNEEPKIARSKINEKSNLKCPPVISNSITTGENEENIENCDYSLNESTYNENEKEASLLKSTKKINFIDGSVISNSIIMDKIEKNLIVSPVSSTAEKSEDNMGSFELISNDNVSNNKQIETANLKNYETSDFGDTCAASDSFTQEKCEHNIESSDIITFNSIPLKKRREITKMTCTDYLEEQENKAIWRLTSSVIKSSNFSLEVLDQRHSGSDLGSENYDSITPQNRNFIERGPAIKCRSSIKSEILKKLNKKLESYGIDASQNTLSEKDMTRVGRLLKEERDRIAEELPDYDKLRQLIKDSAHRRIEDNLRAHSFYVS